MEIQRKIQQGGKSAAELSPAPFSAA